MRERVAAFIINGNPVAKARARLRYGNGKRFFDIQHKEKIEQRINLIEQMVTNEKFIGPCYMDITFFMPIHPSRFCENLMKSLKGGRLAQRKNERWNFTKDNFEAVPYYDFYQEKSQLTIFPASVLEQSLDVPLIIKGNPLEILGSGFIEDNLDYMQAVFLKLDQKKFDKAKKSLTERLDLKF